MKSIMHIWQRSMFLIMACALSMLCFSSNAFSATLYVAQNGSDNNPGTQQKPFKTIQKAAYVVNPGDTVIVGDGIYTVTDTDWAMVRINRGGTKDNWVTFKSENKWGAILDGKNITPYGFVFNVKNVSYVTIDSFEIRGCTVAGIYSGLFGHYINVNRNLIHNIGRKFTESAFGICGIYQDRGTSYHVYTNNVFHDIGRLPHGFAYDQNHDHAIYIAGGTNGEISNNLFYNINAGWPIHMYSANPLSDTDTWDINNNIFAFLNIYRDGHILVANNLAPAFGLQAHGPAGAAGI